MKKNYIALLAAAVLLCSCSANTTSTPDISTPPVTAPQEGVTYDAYVLTPDGERKEITDKPAVTESTAAKEETTEAQTQSGSKAPVDSEFCILNNVHFGMTYKEAIQVLGAPDELLEANDGSNKVILKYGKSEMVFGGDCYQTLNDMNAKHLPEIARDMSEVVGDGEPRLNIIRIFDHSLDDALYEGVGIGADVDEVTQAYFIDENMELPAAFKVMEESGEMKVLYGIDEVQKDVPAPDDDSLHSAGYIRKTDGTALVTYQVYENDNMGLVTYELDDDGNVVSVIEICGVYR